LSAINDLEDSIRRGGNSADIRFFLAMARAQANELDQARKIYDEADRWMRENHSEDPNFKRFREEAAAVIYMKSLDAARPSPKQ
jgi:hypothetical protein